jgi:hypothetical protein
MDWHPISQAPRDGRAVLVWCPASAWPDGTRRAGFAAVARWSAHWNGWCWARPSLLGAEEELWPPPSRWSPIDTASLADEPRGGQPVAARQDRLPVA